MRFNTLRPIALLFLALLTFLALLPAHLAAQQCWDMVWSDEFDGPAIDLSKWEFEINGQGGGNNELQYYTDRADNATISGGILSLIAREETYTGPDGTRNYTSARLRTLNQGDWTYGKIEASIKLPAGQGLWPAFWMLPTDWVYGSWPLSGEIDIMENVGYEPDVVHGTLHYGDAWPNNSYSGSSTTAANASTTFHTYTVEWEETEIRWYLDGVLFSTRTPADLAPKAWPFDQRFHILLNVAVGGDWPGAPDGSTVFPQTMEVDYVRVYQGINSYAITGNDTVYQGDVGKTYEMPDITGASYNWSVPAGATITSGQGTRTITVDWGTTGGNVSCTVTTSCAARTYDQAVTVSAPLTTSHVFEDFDGQRNVGYDLTLTSGTLTQSAANPAPDAVNGSANVGQYVRNASEQYDVLFMTSGDIGNANDFVFGRDHLFVDVYTDAPVGTAIAFNLEDSSVSNTTAYPAGRHSSYSATTTQQNAWETLEFTWTASPDPQATGIWSVDQLAFLMNSDSYTSDTYYFDNVRVGSEAAPPVLSTEVVEDYDGTSNWTYSISSGTYNGNTANPGADAVNGSATVAQYSRNSSEQYDTLIFGGLTAVTDASLLTAGDSKILVDVYSMAPSGTLLSFNLENSALSAGAYPAGRHSIYQAVTTTQNAWETVTFEYAYSPDAGTPDIGIDQLVFLFDSDAYTNDTYYLDNVRVVHTKAPVVGTLLSQGQPVTASSIENAGTAAANAVDGNTGTRWASAFSDNEWIYVDLGSNATIDRVVLNWEAAYGQQYQIQVSGDAANWTTIYTETGGNGGIDDLTVAGSGRYVRMLGIVRGLPYGYSLWELEVYGIAGSPVPTNVSLGKPAFSSSDESAGFLPANAVDDNPATRWASAWSDPQWIYVDLQATFNLTSVTLVWETAASAAYQIQVSADASTWTTIYTDNAANGGTDNIVLSVAGRYVRMYSTARTTQWGNSLYEMEVYGTP